MVTLTRFRALFQPTSALSTAPVDPDPSQIPSGDQQALLYALRRAVNPSDAGLLRTLPIFQPGYGEDEPRKKKKKKFEWEEEEDLGGDEDVVDDVDGKEVGVPTVILRKKTRNTGSAPKLFSHLYPESDYVCLGELAVMRIVGCSV